MAVNRTVDAVVDTVATHSWALLTPSPERAAAVAAIRTHLAGQQPTGEFVLRVVRTQRVLRS